MKRLVATLLIGGLILAGGCSKTSKPNDRTSGGYVPVCQTNPNQQCP